MGPVMRWGLLGTGAMAATIADAFDLVDNARIARVGARRPDAAREFARSREIAAHGTIEAVLDDDGLDAVFIATSHASHVELTIAAVAAGKHVVCEKPLATSAGDGRRAVDAAADAGCYLLEAMWTRFLPLAATVKAHVEAGTIGAVRHIAADFGYPVDPRTLPRLFDPDQAGGSLLDRGVYPISLAVWLLGSPADVDGYASVGPTGVDETATCRLRWSDGATAELRSSIVSMLGNEAWVLGSEGHLRLHAPFYRPQRLTISPDVVTAAGVHRRLTANSSRLRQGLTSRLDPLLARRSRVDRDVIDRVAGSGHAPQIRAACADIAAGRLESATMPTADSITVLDIVDRCRSRWEVTER